MVNQNNCNQQNLTAADCQFTAKDLRDIEAAIAKGVKSVKYTDKEVTYRSVSEMLQVRDLMRQCLGIGTNADGTRGTRRVACHGKGL